MPLLAPVIKAARARAEQMQRALGAAHMSAWRSMLATRWRPLPAVERGRVAPGGRTFHAAVDGTSHSVQLSTGAHFILGAAAAVGPPPLGQRDRADMEIVPARYDDAAAASARDLLMRSLEVRAASEAAGLLVGEGMAARAILWTDGSLYADLSHMAGAPAQVRWGSAIERAGELLRNTAALLSQVERSELWLIGVGKTQRASFLYDALACSAADGKAPQSERPADGELLAIAPTGWSWPVILDGTRFPHSTRAADDALQGCPAIISCYVRPHALDLPLRVDVPASQLGLSARLLPHRTGDAPLAWPAWVPDPDAMLPIVQAVLQSYGGIRAYNAPLYAVDRVVRLSRRELEVRYLPICAKVAGLPAGALSVDRGRRRFLMD